MHVSVISVSLINSTIIHKGYFWLYSEPPPQKCQHCSSIAGRALGRGGLEWTAFPCGVTPSASTAPPNTQRNTLPRETTSCCDGAPGWAMREEQGEPCSPGRVPDKSPACTQPSASSEHPTRHGSVSPTSSGVQQRPTPKSFMAPSSQGWEPRIKHVVMLGAKSHLGGEHQMLLLSAPLNIIYLKHRASPNSHGAAHPSVSPKRHRFSRPSGPRFTGRESTPFNTSQTH